MLELKALALPVLLPFDPDAPRNITRGWLDPLNQQSPHAADLLKLSQDVVADAAYRLRLKGHYNLFKSGLEPAPEQHSPDSPEKIP